MLRAARGAAGGGVTVVALPCRHLVLSGNQLVSWTKYTRMPSSEILSQTLNLDKHSKSKRAFANPLTQSTESDSPSTAVSEVRASQKSSNRLLSAHLLCSIRRGAFHLVAAAAALL